jgi:hypothetical protein
MYDRSAARLSQQTEPYDGNPRSDMTGPPIRRLTLKLLVTFSALVMSFVLVPSSLSPCSFQSDQRSNPNICRLFSCNMFFMLQDVPLVQLAKCSVGNIFPFPDFQYLNSASPRRTRLQLFEGYPDAFFYGHFIVST